MALWGAEDKFTANLTNGSTVAVAINGTVTGVGTGLHT